MNEETRNEDLDELREVASEVTDALADARADEAEAAAGLVSELQEEVESLQEQLQAALDRVAELEATPAVAAAPAGDAELQALAATVRQCQRNGHPDLGVHLNALLAALGAD